MDENSIRLHVHSELERIFPDAKSIYYRPPGDIILTRPSIVYDAVSEEPSYASNRPYTIGMSYQVTLLSDLPGYFEKRKIYDMSGVTVSHNSSYVSDDVVHDVFTITMNRM